MKVIEWAAHCAIFGGCLLVLWVIFALAADSPWGIALICAWAVLMVVAIWRGPPDPR